MPELPEVETIRRSLEHNLVGKTIIRVFIRNIRLRWIVPNEIHCLNKQLVLSISRRAKYLLLELPKGWIIIHFGMSGSLRLESFEQSPIKHDHIDLIMSDNKILRYNDPRRFGAWLWSNDLASSNVLSNLGPEPLSDEFNAEYLFNKSFNTRTLIKQWLMDPKVVVGIGNIYVNESLFIAGVLPNRLTMSLNKKTIILLVDAIKTTLCSAIEQGGTTLRNFFHIDNKPGCFNQKLRVYARAGKMCYTCKTLICKNKQGQRSTFWCPRCQS
ncbi:bifunctional DNA-formamidopyrimidine glycosylase/DNA-(apurinic or apyrimidinic site) lyase [Pantoea sp. Aalb]|uniref:bifunctional DNA-formamidopyrimidine glycosylase/DNA-(apurinic or apyrimidinic site) lyase n=1 Tax=Pantoea sp. Aalb TaxID=2576762 RepID=UPI001324FA58|nr:bifunctional DNA-formamidopyrimidine glycosylase/DNA-(apurinic or apyrimidinic site) lyase [Pantoea sp. Aalb]MXP67944.1 bifunctional DNA-formamidopyrimidine glycosylase/DNA-(apurinic or apyrimidinic site) lyase [Pantoea sp. Aalb]